MYTGVMQRTQIYLDETETSLLERAAERTGASRSELIRRAIRTQYGNAPATARLAALRASAGARAGDSTTGAASVEQARGDLNERLEQLGLG